MKAERVELIKRLRRWQEVFKNSAIRLEGKEIKEEIEDVITELEGED